MATNNTTLSQQATEKLENFIAYSLLELGEFDKGSDTRPFLRRITMYRYTSNPLSRARNHQTSRNSNHILGLMRATSPHLKISFRPQFNVIFNCF
jgi:hypothetical protein